MTNVTIHRCPVCESIGSHTKQLVSELKGDPVPRVDVVDGEKGEFMIDVDGQRINGIEGDTLRDPTELATEIRGVEAATA